MNNDELVPTLVDAAIARLRRMDMCRTPLPNMPEAMRDHDIPTTNDWLGWKPVASTVTDADIQELERKLNLQFPLLYKQLLQYHHFYDLGIQGVGIESHPVDTWRKTLNNLYKAYEPERIVGLGFLPFGSECFLDAGLLCFDTRQMSNGDCPVVYWDHEEFETDEEIQPLFSSAQAMFRCMRVVTQFDFGFFHHFPDESPRLLEDRQQALGLFLAQDPLGAGGVARHYWTSGGVTPN